MRYGWEKLASYNLTERHLPHVAVKEAVFRLPASGVDVFLGPEMKSTGEVWVSIKILAGICQKSARGGTDLPLSGTVFISIKDEDKPAFIEICRNLVEDGFSILATGGTTAALKAPVYRQHASTK